MAHGHVHQGPRERTGAGLLAVDFANSVACPSCRVADALSSIEEFNRWIQARPNLSISKAGRKDIGSLRQFRADIRVLLGACVGRTSPPASSLARVNSTRQRATGRNDLMWHRGRWMVMERSTRRSAADGIAGAVAQSVTDLLTSPGRATLRACRGPGCNHFILARTRQQIWCSPTGCGNRVRAARHYRRVMGRRSTPRRKTRHSRP